MLKEVKPFRCQRRQCLGKMQFTCLQPPGNGSIEELSKCPIFVNMRGEVFFVCRLFYRLFYRSFYRSMYLRTNLS